jgi:hypothetical protein
MLDNYVKVQIILWGDVRMKKSKLYLIRVI